MSTSDQNKLIEDKIIEYADNIGYEADSFMYGGKKEKRKIKKTKTKTKSRIKTLQKKRTLTKKKSYI